MIIDAVPSLLLRCLGLFLCPASPRFDPSQGHIGGCLLKTAWCRARGMFFLTVFWPPFGSPIAVFHAPTTTLPRRPTPFMSTTQAL